MAQSTNNAPVMVIRDGALKASIWENEGENGSYLTTTFARTYTKDGETKDTNSFGRNDLLALSELARRAYGKVAEVHRELNSD